MTYTSLFPDDATAESANTGQPTTLALTDPDSNTVVPESSPRFSGDFMVDSQGGLQQIYVSKEFLVRWAGVPHPIGRRHCVRDDPNRTPHGDRLHQQTS